MRRAVAILVALLSTVNAGDATAALPGNGEFPTAESVMRWINNYRLKPEPVRLPAAVRTMSTLGAFRDVESSGVHVGFIAGVLGANPARAEKLVARMLFIPEADHWVIVHTAMPASSRSDTSPMHRRAPTQSLESLDRHDLGENRSPKDAMA